MDRRARLTLALAAGSAALLFAAACGGDDSSNSSGGTANGAGGFTAYLDCLREQGIDVPNTVPSGQPRPGGSGRPTAFPSGRPSGAPTARPSGAPGGMNGSPGPGGGFPGGGFRPEGVDDATWQKAQEACRSSMPTGGPGGGGFPGGRNGGGAPAADAAYRNCLSDRGVDLRAAGTSTADAKVTEALAACAVLSPSPTP